MTTVEKFRMQRRYRSERRRIILLGVIAVIMMFALGMSCGRMIARAGAPTSATGRTKKYISIEIKPGDTLWDLATAYMDDDYYTHTQDYVNEVLKLNSIGMQDNITAGEYIILPIYS